MRKVSENENDPHRYDDLIDREHHVSGTHRQMDMAHRAAQFIPFSALAGFEEKIQEEKRVLNTRRILSDSEKEELDAMLRYLAENSGTECTVTYFVSDPCKEGGNYMKKSGTVRKIDPLEHAICFKDRTVLPLSLVDEIEIPDQ